VNDQHGKQMTTSMCMYARSSDLISSGPIHTVQLRVLNMLLRMLKLTTLPWRACLWGEGSLRPTLVSRWVAHCAQLVTFSHNRTCLGESDSTERLAFLKSFLTLLTDFV